MYAHVKGKCKTNLMYILRAIVMLFLRAKVIPVNPQIHANVMRPVCAYFINIYYSPLSSVFKMKTKNIRITQIQIYEI
jgi:hypothetical protein